MDPRARAVVDRLRLDPHPEGGYFREVYRLASRVQPGDGRPGRAAVTTILFLLAAEEHSRWHSVRSDEIWHFYDGDPLELFVGDPALGGVERVTLSRSATAGRLVAIVPAGHWQAARSLGAYTLVGCTVAPGFDFADFRFLRDDVQAVAALQRLDPEFAAFV